MFGDSKPLFGQSSTASGFSFSNPSSVALRQPTYRSPAATATPFGQAPSSSTMFGAQLNTGTGLFGATNLLMANGTAMNTQPAFGSFVQQQPARFLAPAYQPNPNQSSLFPTSNTSAFGTANISNSVGFGTSRPSNFGIVQPNQTHTGTGMIGATNTNSSFGQTIGGMHGSTNGTAIVKYQPTNCSDIVMKNGQSLNINTKLFCITVMDVYGSKSIEELRYEDYVANRKGPQTGLNTFGFGLFNTSIQQPTVHFAQQPSQTASNSVLAQNSIFGQTTRSSFGCTSSQPGKSILAKPFSTTSSGIGFGGTGSSTGNVLGANPFSQTGQTISFGQPTGQSNTTTFRQQASGFNAFGQNNQQLPVFGNNANVSFSVPFTSGFGMQSSQNTATNTLFGNPNTGFGTSTGFVAPSASNSNCFSGFGNNNTGGSIFNTTVNKPAPMGFALGSQPLATSFGVNSMANMGKPSIFGNIANKTTGYMGGSTQTGVGLTRNNATFGGLGTFPPLGNLTLSFAQPQSGVPIHQKILSLVTSPYGDNPIFKKCQLYRNDVPQPSKATNPVAQLNILEANANQFKVSTTRPKNQIKIKTKKSLFDGLEEYDKSVEEAYALKPNARRLILKPKLLKQTPSNIESSFDLCSPQTEHLKWLNNCTNNLSKSSNSNSESSFINPNDSDYNKELDSIPRKTWLHNVEKNQQQNGDLINSKTWAEDTANDLLELIASCNADFEKIVAYKDTSNLDVMEESISDDVSLEADLFPSPHPAGITLKRQGYYIIPSLKELESYLSEDGTCIVPNLRIGRRGYGNVFFDIEMDVANINFDEIVHFHHKEIILYPDDENKPPIGSQLNREAQITLEQVWPQDKTKHQSIKCPERLSKMDYEDKLRRVCEKYDMQFIEYRPETGSWVFRVKHFSKYGLNDSDDEDNGQCSKVAN